MYQPNNHAWIKHNKAKTIAPMDNEDDIWFDKIATNDKIFEKQLY